MGFGVWGLWWNLHKCQSVGIIQLVTTGWCSPLQARKKRFNKLQDNAQKYLSVKKRKTGSTRTKKNVKHTSR